jgi:hypothetical protein
MEGLSPNEQGVFPSRSSVQQHNYNVEVKERKNESKKLVKKRKRKCKKGSVSGGQWTHPSPPLSPPMMSI